MSNKIVIKGFFSNSTINKNFSEHRKHLHKMTINKNYSYLRHYTLSANHESIDDITSLSIAFYNSDNTMIPVAWGMVDNSGEIGVFVQRCFRNQGIGSKIVKKILSNKNNPKKITARPWTNHGDLMYSKFNNKVSYVE